MAVDPCDKPVGSPANLGNDPVVRLQAARDAALQAARSAIRDTTRLTRLLAILSEPGEIEALLDRALSTLSELFVADILVLHDPIGTGTSLPIASVGIPESMVNEPFSCDRNHILYQVMRERKPLIVPDACEDKTVDVWFRELDVRVMVSLPVFGENSIRGVLIVARCHPNPFADSEIDLLSSMAYRIGLALEDTQRKVQLEHIIQSGNVIGRHLDPKMIASEAARLMRGIARADIGAVVLRHPRGEFSCSALHGLPWHCAQALCQFASFLVLNTEFAIDRAYCTDTLPELLHPLGLCISPHKSVATILAIPIHHKNHLAGVLFALRFEPLAFNAITTQMGMLYANYISAALENAVLYQAGQKELSERIRAEQALRASDDRFRALIRSVSDIIAILSPSGTIRYISPAAESLWGCSVVALHGQSILEYLDGEDKERFLEFLKQMPQRHVKSELKSTLRCIDVGKRCRFFEVTLVNLVHESAVNGIVATFHDATERNLYEQELSKLAYQDPLTGLANRAHFMERLQNALAQGSGGTQWVAVLFFDLDNFKQINDRFGHEYGDRVLCIVADRIRSCMRKEDIAARLGGDEFTLLIEGVVSVEQVLPLAQRLIHLLHQPITIDRHEMSIGASMGIALGQPFQDSCEVVLRNADLAMYLAKNSGKGCFRIYSEEIL
jgi:diguanylate cyclase (GGDEF)-like protein/PAS domain S-box-containing protein